MPEHATTTTIAECHADDPRMAALRAVVAGVEQTDWVDFSAPWHQSNHLLVATLADHSADHSADRGADHSADRGADQIVGFLRFVVQPIGPDSDCETVRLDGRPLVEAKVLAFAVLSAHQGQGIGRALQRAAIERAAALGCYQVRSHSSGHNQANHHLKLKLGFAVHPIVRDDDSAGVYFVLPLRAPYL